METRLKTVALKHGHITASWDSPKWYSQKDWTGWGSPLPETLILLYTKIRDFPNPVSDLTKI